MGIAGAAVASAIEIPIFESQLSSKNSQISNLNSQLSTSQATLNQVQGYLTLSPAERPIVEAIADTIIPPDSNVVGGKDAGVPYFIDGMLAGSYGKNGNMYMQGPFIPSNLTGPVTVNGVTYTGGTVPARIESGMYYQYASNLREFWRLGLQFLEAYSNSAYGGNFESLPANVQTQILTDLYNNKPTNFTGPMPQEFFFEIYDMVIAGWFTDPLYKGNINKVSWYLTAFSGTNQGAAYGGTAKLMVAINPTVVPPLSLSEYQRLMGGNM